MNPKTELKTKILKVFPGLNALRFKLQVYVKKAGYVFRYLPGSSKVWGPPRGFYTDALAYNAAKGSRNATIEVVHLKEGQKLKRQLPKTNSQLVINKFSKCLSASTIPKTGYKLHDTRYFSGHGGTVVTADDKIFIPVSPLKNEWYPERHQSLYKMWLPPLKKIEKVILIDTREADSNYGHWMMDHIPRFYWLQKIGIDFSAYTLITSMGTHKYYTNTLQLLADKGFVFKSIVPVTKNLHLSCTEMVIPPYATDDLTQDGKARDEAEGNFLKECFLRTEETISLPKRIYLSRRKTIRTFSGELQLAEQLKAFGIHEFFLEELTVQEQARLFNNADLIIGLHGSGFTNLLFCQPGTTVVEIFSPDYIVTDFWSISNICYLNYFAYCNDSYYKGISVYRLARNAPTTLDIESFIAWLKESKLV